MISSETVRDLTQRILSNLESPQIPMYHLLPALAEDCRRILRHLDDDSINLNAERHIGYPLSSPEEQAAGVMADHLIGGLRAADDIIGVLKHSGFRIIKGTSSLA